MYCSDFKFTQILYFFQYKESLVQNFTVNAMPHFESGRLNPIIDQVFSLEDIGKAHQLMEENKNTGKIILKIRQDKQAHNTHINSVYFYMLTFLY
jgi:NADPH:quinone reductase-like Zn-dependent oxidoreductase